MKWSLRTSGEELSLEQLPEQLEARGAPESLVLELDGDGTGLLCMEEARTVTDRWTKLWAGIGRPVAQAMARAGRGRIVLLTAAPHLHASVRPLALELAPHTVTVNAVASVGKVTAEEVEHWVQYLCSEEAGFVTAQTVRVGL